MDSLLLSIYLTTTSKLYSQIYMHQILITLIFFINACGNIDSFGKMDNIILCGDFNLVPYSSIDYKNYKDSNHNINSRKLLIKKMNERELMDPFRHLHGETRKYTWKRFSSLQRGKLDFFLTTKSLILSSEIVIQT